MGRFGSSGCFGGPRTRRLASVDGVEGGDELGGGFGGGRTALVRQ